MILSVLVTDVTPIDRAKSLVAITLTAESGCLWWRKREIWEEVFLADEGILWYHFPQSRRVELALESRLIQAWGEFEAQKAIDKALDLP